MNTKKKCGFLKIPIKKNQNFQEKKYLFHYEVLIINHSYKYNMITRNMSNILLQCY